MAEESDLADVARLIGEFRSWFAKATPTDEEIGASVSRIHSGMDGEYILGGADGARPDGVVQLRYRWSLWTSSEDAWLEDVFVSEQARGTGLGRALVLAAIDRARERGCARIELDVDESNTPAFELYRALGFRGDLKADPRSLLLGLRL
jgi:ribosomal protein S18 acetylase RimI-like enzyme